YAFRRPLVCPRAAEDVLHRVVPLVARVFEELIFRMELERQRHRPWTRPCLRVGDRCRIPERRLIDALESLDDFQLLTRRQRVAVARDADLAVEVRRLDDERVAVPAAT